jgi:lipoprotein-anchoring transpeptidase ErfK/SrfK
MDFSVYNMERSVAPKAPTPWWVYVAVAAAVALAVIGGISLVMHFRDKPAAPPVMTDEPDQPEVEVSAPVELPKTAPPTPPAPDRPATSASAPTTPAAPVPPAASLASARDAQASGDLITARARALEVWKASRNDGERLQAEEILNETGIALVMTPREMPEKLDYTVKPGDTLDKIARTHGTTVELLRKSNNISGHIIRVGDRMRILDGKFSVSVSKSRNDLELYLNGEFFKRYPVGTGEFNKTPVGDFFIDDRISQPTWWRPDGKAIPYGDPENLLGTHWLSINVRGYGLHGTWEPDTIGKQLSAGCVRMLNEDIEELFTLLPVGTPVSIRD